MSIHLLTTLDVERTTCDGGGLYLTVDPKWRTRCWAFKYRFNGKPRTMGLGSAHVVTLAQAREEAAKYRAIKALGRCPLTERRERQAAAKAANATARLTLAQARVKKFAEMLALAQARAEKLAQTRTQP
jgi:hypothetical protein